jgi:hypothetical protein
MQKKPKKIHKLLRDVSPQIINSSDNQSIETIRQGYNPPSEWYGPIYPMGIMNRLIIARNIHISLEIGLLSNMVISSYTISGFDQHRLKIESEIEMKLSYCETGNGLRPTQKDLRAVNRFIRYLLPSIEYLSASEPLYPVFIGIIVVYLQIFGSAQTLQPEPFILIDLQRCFIDYLRFSLSAIDCFVCNPLSRQFTNSS